jgi:hypothetical protein
MIPLHQGSPGYPQPVDGPFMLRHICFTPQLGIFPKSPHIYAGTWQQNFDVFIVVCQVTNCQVAIFADPVAFMTTSQAVRNTTSARLLLSRNRCVLFLDRYLHALLSGHLSWLEVSRLQNWQAAALLKRVSLHGVCVRHVCYFPVHHSHGHYSHWGFHLLRYIHGCFDDHCPNVLV